MTDKIAYFDGHNDVLLRLSGLSGGDPVKAFVDGNGQGHLDLPRARQGGFVGGLFALYAPSEKKDFGSPGALADNLPPMLAPEAAWTSIRKQVAIFTRLVTEAGAQLARCTSAADIRAAIADGKLALVLHIEGADAIEADLDLLHVLYGAGLRSLGPVWSRPTIFGHGVPFKFPSTPDVGEGLTEDGKRLVRECNRLKILIDLSHMNEAGFWDVARHSDAPLIATHSNVHAICPSPRNLTDKQLAAIRESDGLVGLNFACGFLREDGRMVTDTDLEWMVRHVDALIEKLGENRVGIGSDFDGAPVPNAIGTVAGTPALFEALRAHGYDDALLRKIGSENWIAALERVWGD